MLNYKLLVCRTTSPIPISLPPLSPKICIVGTRWMSRLLESFDLMELSWVYCSQAKLKPGRLWLIESLCLPQAEQNSLFSLQPLHKALLFQWHGSILGHLGCQAREAEWTKHPHLPPKGWVLDPGASLVNEWGEASITLDRKRCPEGAAPGFGESKLVLILLPP